MRRPPPSMDATRASGTIKLSDSVKPHSELNVTRRIEVVAQRLGISRRTLERERAAGRFPPPDLYIGKMPLWKPETVYAYVEKGGRP